VKIEDSPLKNQADGQPTYDVNNLRGIIGLKFNVQKNVFELIFCNKSLNIPFLAHFT